MGTLVVDALERAERLLLTAAAAPLLREQARRDGHELTGWRLRAVHRHGRSGCSVVYAVELRDGPRDRSSVHVLHVSDHPVPGRPHLHAGPDGPVHGWRFPADPYLPGLADAVATATNRRLLDELGAPTGAVQLRTVSYRPTRRAVVAVRVDGEPVAYRKVLGGRSEDRVDRRTRRVVDVHAALAPHVPVPAVLHADPALGLVTLAPVAGRSLRDRLRGGAPLPPAEVLADTVARLAAVPDPRTGADPGAYADVERHAELLGRLVPERARLLAAITAGVRAVGGPVGTVHGDLHDGQLVVDADRVLGLLDLDGVGVGRVALDAGRLVANIEVATLHPTTSPAAAAAATGLAAEVAAALHDVVDERDLAVAAAGAWVALATGPHRVRTDDWERAVRRRLAHAETWWRRATT